MNNSEIKNELEKIESELSYLPDAYLVYKTIRGCKQPYLQWHEAGKTKSRYVKMEERDQVLIDVQMRDSLQQQKKRLLSYLEERQSAWKKYPGLRRQNCMTLPVGIGIQSFSEVMEKHLFYVDKSMLIKSWWENSEKVTLITRPRRFGKSLNLDMLDCFFSTRYANRHDLFEQLQIWNCTRLHSEQGKWPVLHFDFSNLKILTPEGLRTQMTQVILEQYYRYHLISSEEWTENVEACWSMEKIESELCCLCRLLSEQNQGRNVIILIDEYDTPIQEAWGSDNYGNAAALMRMVFHCLLKSNPFLEKALLTGITRVSRESLFSDMNNITVSSVTDDRYSEYFGFTEEEVFAAMDSQSLEEHAEVKRWYDGFVIGSRADIYNPWSITNYLRIRKFDAYWANTSANKLVGHLVDRGNLSFKNQFAELLNGKSIDVTLKENITWEDLEKKESLVWGLLLATGYITGVCLNANENLYRIHITNFEVMRMFEEVFLRWFDGRAKYDYHAFLDAMFQGDAETMDAALAEIMLESFRYYDVGNASEDKKTESFYHGFVLGMISSLHRTYLITSNRESGYGRYDILIEPKEITPSAKAVILEFKVNRKSSLSLEESAEEALKQIEKQDYAAQLRSRGFENEQILSYGLAFHGKEVCVKKG